MKPRRERVAFPTVTVPTEAPAITIEEARAIMETYAFSAALGLEIVEWRRGEVRLRFRPPAHARNPGAPALPAGALHGGAIMTVLDEAGCLAVTTVNGIDVSTVDMRLDFVRPAVEEEFLVEARPVRVGKRLATSDATLSALDGRALAVARMTTTW